MAKLTKAQREWRPGMPKKRRSIRIMFASTILILEAFLVLFASLAIFGLQRDAMSPAVIFGGGLVLFAALIATCAFLTKPAGPVVGWVLQLAIIATGFLEPIMFLVGALFAATWWYGLKTGMRLDRENRQRDRDQEQWEKEHPGEAGPGTAGTTGTAATD